MPKLLITLFDVSHNGWVKWHLFEVGSVNKKISMIDGLRVNLTSSDK